MAEKRQKLSPRARRIVWQKCCGHCAYCGAVITEKEMQADHVVPLHLGGKHLISNLLPACRSCNHYKHTLTLEKFREQIFRTSEVLHRDSATFRLAERFGLVKVQPQKVKFYFEECGIYDQIEIEGVKMKEMWNECGKKG